MKINIHIDMINYWVYFFKVAADRSVCCRSARRPLRLRDPLREGVLLVTLHPVIGRCPVCGDELAVTRLQCGTCDTQIDGRFRLGRFQRLSADQLAFVEVFVKNRGIIKDVEAELGISYPTVRARLDEALRAMGFPAGGEDDPRVSPREARAQAREERRRILEELKEKRLTAEEAARLLAG
jgi:hypothetical protein